MTILVFTGGGLAAALNPTLYGVISEARARGIRVLGGVSGWSCLLDGGTIIDLSSIDPAPLARQSGALLRSSRTNPFKREHAREQIDRSMKEHGVDAIIAIGGDDTLGAAARAHAEWTLPIVGIPKTVDNDLDGTYWTPGFPTAAQYTAQFTHDIKTHAAYSLSRVFLIEVLGGHAGWLAAAAHLGGADAVLVPECDLVIDHVLETIEKRYRTNGNFAVVAVSKEANLGDTVTGVTDQQTDEYGVKRQELIVVDLAKIVRERLGLDAKILLPGNAAQSVQPIQKDYETAHALGKRAVELISKQSFGMAAIIGGPDLAITEISLAQLTTTYRHLPEAFFDATTLTPTQAFHNYMHPAEISVTRDIAYEQLMSAILSHK